MAPSTEGQDHKGKPEISLKSLVARLHFEVFMINGVIIFVPVLLLCLFFVLSMLALNRASANNLYQDINHWEALAAGLQSMDPSQVGPYVIGLASAADEFNPASPLYSGKSPRLLVGSARSFGEEMKLKTGGAFLLGTRFTVMAWVRQAGVGQSSKLLRKTKLDAHGEQWDCWRMQVGPLEFFSRTQKDDHFYEWARDAGFNEVSRDGFKFSSDLKTAAQSWHLIAMSWVYDVGRQQSTMLWGVDGEPFVRSPENETSLFPVVDCVDGELMVGDSGVEIADMLWLPWQATDAEFRSMYTGDLRAELGNLREEELELSGPWRAAAEAQEARLAEERKTKAVSVKSWLHSQQPTLAGAGSHTFEPQDHSCVAPGPDCEVRVFPKGDWFGRLPRDELLSSRIGLGTVNSGCSDRNVLRALSLAPPRTSTFPADAPEGLLDRHVVNASAVGLGSWRICWLLSGVSVDVGGLEVRMGPPEYIEILGDASMSIQPYVQPDYGPDWPLRKFVPKASVYTVTVWVYPEYGSSNFPWLFQKTADPDIRVGGTIFGFYLSRSSQNFWIWRNRLADNSLTTSGAFSPGGCSGAGMYSHMKHVAYVHDAAAAVGRVYLDGEFCSEIRTDGTVDPQRYMEDADGLLLFGRSTRSNCCNYRGEVKGIRWYGRGLSVDEIRAQASDPAHRACVPKAEMEDDKAWTDASGRGCWDVYEATQSAGTVNCTAEARAKCPVACPDVKKCFTSAVVSARPLHVFPRASEDERRVCLGAHLDKQRLVAACRASDASMLSHDKIGWSVENAVENGLANVSEACDKFEHMAAASSSCPVGRESLEALSRFGTTRGGDMTILFWGHELMTYCNLFRPKTAVRFYIRWNPWFYGNITTGSMQEMAPGGERGLTVVSVSPSRGKYIVMRSGRFYENTWWETDPCVVEALSVWDVRNLRVIDQFLSKGELVELYYRELLARSKRQYTLSPVSDQSQFLRKPSSFEPYTKALMTYTMPVLWQPQGGSGGEGSCSRTVARTVDAIARKRARSASCREGCAEVDPGICNRSHASGRSVGQLGAPWRGRRGAAWNLPVLRNAVLRSSDGLMDPAELLSAADGLKVVFLFYSPSTDAFSLAELSYDLTTSPVRGELALLYGTKSGAPFYVFAALSLLLALLIIVLELLRVLAARKLPTVEQELAQLQHTGELHDHFAVPRPRAAAPPEAAVFFTVGCSLAVLVYTAVAMAEQSKDQAQIEEQADALLHTDDLAKRVESLGVLVDAMWEQHSLSVVGTVLGCLLAIMVNVHLRFHIRVAIIVHTLWRSISPLLHFLVIFMISFFALGFAASQSLATERSDFSGLDSLSQTQFDFLLGSRPSVEGGASTVHAVYQGVFMIFMMLVMFNVFLAIIMDSYSTEVQHVQDIKVEFTLFYDLWLLASQAVNLRWSRDKRWMFALLLTRTPEERPSISSEEDLKRLVAACPGVEAIDGGWLFRHEVYGDTTFSGDDLARFFGFYGSMPIMRMPEAADEAQTEDKLGGGGLPIMRMPEAADEAQTEDKLGNDDRGTPL